MSFVIVAGVLLGPLTVNLIVCKPGVAKTCRGFLIVLVLFVPEAGSPKFQLYCCGQGKDRSTRSTVSPATQTISKSNTWKGGNSPFNVSYGKLMMWFFLVSDALTFSGLLVAYGFVRHEIIGQHYFNDKSVAPGADLSRFKMD